jgi:TonB-dependent starch-binding outer membrane protein SusC
VSLSFFLFGVTGINVLNSTKTFADSDGQRFGWNYHADADNNVWRKPGDLAERPRPVIGGNRLSNSASTRFLEDGSYLRLRNVNLSYDFSRNLTSKMKIQGLRFYVMAQNLFTWTGYSGVDPEMGIDGVEFFKYPVPKAVTFGLDVTF